LFAQDGFSITTDELALVKALDDESELNPTEWFDPKQLWEFLLYVVEPEVLPNVPPFELPRDICAPIPASEIFKLSTAEYPRCEKTLNRETNMRI
jgi:hypothetical protein